MDTKKQEAERWIQIAENLISENALTTAENALRISFAIHPTKKAEELIKKIKTKQSGEPEPSTSHSQSQNVAGNCSKSMEDTEKNYSDEDVELAKKINEAKDYYEILGVARDAPDADIRSAYKKLALKFHPDKSTVPGGGDAFKAIGKATGILTDAQKRKHYDEHGTDLDEDETSAEELAQLLLAFLLLQHIREQEEKKRQGLFRRVLNCLICKS